MKTKNLKW